MGVNSYVRWRGFKLTLSPGKRLLCLPNFSNVVNSEVEAAMEARLPIWVTELIQRGVAERKARQLAFEIPEDQQVSDRIEYADQLIQQDRRGRGKIANSAGFLIWAIESNLSVPAGFETTRKRKLRADQQDAENDQRFRMIRLRERYDAFCQEAINNKLEQDYPPERLEARLNEQMKLIKRQQPEWFGRTSQDTRREVALGRLRGERTRGFEFAQLRTLEQTRSPAATVLALSFPHIYTTIPLFKIQTV